MNNPTQTAYLAPIGLEALLEGELKDVTQVFGRLVLAKGPPQTAYWSQNIWYNPKFIPIQSIGDAAKALRAVQRNWWPYLFQHHRRTKLIQEKLPHIAPRPLEFLGKVPTAPLGSWMLADDHTLLMAAHCSSPMPNGEWIFDEDKITPPSRAYLKLWEFFTRFGKIPTKSEAVLDLGASPGGWSWVLSQLCKEVIAIDRSGLDPRILAPNISFKTQNAFTIDLAEFPEVSWVFSDVVCYPDKLYEFVNTLVSEFPLKNYVFTIKFQGGDHAEVISRFAALPGRLVHLSQNKHELTWFKVD